jgi:peroxiredoxin
MLAQFLLAGVFGVAGVAKLVDRRGSQDALAGFGMPRALVGPVAVLLPLSELAIAGALLPAATGRHAAAAGLALLVAFSATVGWNLLRGRTPDCHCFGQLHSAPAGWKTLARNVALAGLAVFVLVQPSSSASPRQLGAFAAVALVAGQALLSFTLLRRYGRALERIAELETATPDTTTLEVGAEAPAFVLPAVGGGEIARESLLAHGKPVLLVFTDPGCGPCHALLPDLARWQHELREQLTVALVSRGNPDENAALAGEHGLETVLVQEDREIAELYGAYATPSAVLVGADGRVAHALVVGAAAIEELVGSVVPPPVPILEPSSNGVAKVAVATAAAGGLAALVGSAQASPHGGLQQPSDPELQEIVAILRRSGPRIVRAAKRAHGAVRAQATLIENAGQRQRRSAAKRALAAERREILALLADLAPLEPVGASAYSVRILALEGFSLFARSLQEQERALVATPKVADRLLDEARATWLSALPPLVSAATYLRRG